MAYESTFGEALPLLGRKPTLTTFGRRWALTLFLADLFTLVAATAAATRAVQLYWSSGLVLDHVILAQGICLVGWIFVFYRVGLYQRSFALTARDEVYCVLTALTVGGLPLLILFTIVPAISSSRAVVIMAQLFAAAMVPIERAVARGIHVAISQRREKRIAIVGVSSRVDRTLEQMNPEPGSQVLRVTVEDLESSLAGIDPFADLELDRIPWLRRARNWRCTDLVLTEMPPAHVLPSLLRTAAKERFTLGVAPPRVFSQAYDLRLETHGHQAVIVLAQLPALSHGARILKRGFDLVVAGLLLVVAIPIMALAALAIRLEDGGPILYRQERVGLLGKPFSILKLRSMRIDAEQRSGPMWSPRNDDRTTRVGKFIRRTSIDELPQLFNVLRGDMSIVGPRPERPVFVERFRRELPRYDERHLVRPGITGWAHLNMPRKLDPSAAGERLSHDLWYVEHCSLFMDVSMVFKTGVEFLFQRQ